MGAIEDREQKEHQGPCGHLNSLEALAGDVVDLVLVVLHALHVLVERDELALGLGRLETQLHKAHQMRRATIDCRY